MNYLSELYTYLPIILTFTFLNVIGLISPGPDFAVVVRNSLIYSRRSAILTALGVSVGVTVHITYITLGIGLVITKNIYLMTGLKFLGAGYLIYLGVKGIMSKKHDVKLGDLEHHREISPLKAFRIGFYTNILNVKAMLYFLSLFTAFISRGTPPDVIFIMAVIAFVTTAIWFSIVAVFFSSKYMRSAYNAVSHWVDRVLGVCLASLGIKLLFTKLG